jgi:anti-sigma factor RsiW
MSNFYSHHPEGLLLLQYMDGELPRRQSRRVQHHLEACWECRTEIDDLRNTVSECVRYRNQLLIPSLPAPQRAWSDLNFEIVEAELAAESVVSRLLRWLAPQRAPMRWALPAMLALILSVAIVRELRHTPNVEAAVLLQKAIAADDSNGHPVRRMRIRTAHREWTRVVGRVTHSAANESEIARQFESAHYDWKNALSARAYAEWHDALVKKLDQVIDTEPGVYRITTTTAESVLTSATLKLRKSDLAPIEGRFEFAGAEWVEIIGLADQPDSPPSKIAGTTAGAPRQPGAPAEIFPSIGSRKESEANEELQVVAALHRVGADLGDPVEIKHEGTAVVVSGVGVSPRRQQEIHRALDRLPHVVMRFSEPGLPAGTPAQSEPVTARDAAAAERPIYMARIEQRLGGRPQFERFSGQVLDAVDSGMTRAYALRRLAQQFSASQETSMNAEDRRTLRGIGREHLAALKNDFGRIETAVAPVLTGIGAAAAPLQPGDAPTEWRPAGERVLASAHRVELLIAQVLGVTPNGAGEDALAHLLAALAQLTRDIEQCQRLLSYD